MGGKTVLNMYSGSLSKLLSSIYPEHNWQLWKFNQVPANWWINNAKLFMEKAARELNIKSLEDWYNVSREVFSHLLKKLKVSKGYCKT